MDFFSFQEVKDTPKAFFGHSQKLATTEFEQHRTRRQAHPTASTTFIIKKKHIPNNNKTTMKITRASLTLLAGATASKRVASFAPQHFLQHKQTPRIAARDFSLFSSFLEDPSYSTRQLSFGLEDKGVLAEIAKKEDVVFVDARSMEEIAEEALPRPYVHGNFILQEDLQHLHQILPSKTAPIVVFCKMGGRAKKVCDTLEKNGYTNVSNAGGLADVDFLP
jgi:phage shock protein E